MDKKNKLKVLRSLVRELTDNTLSLKEGETTELDWATDTIYLNLDGSEPDLGFRRHLCEKHREHNAYTVDELIWSVLHEIGHYMTVDDLCEGWEEEEAPVRAVCAMLSTEQVAASERLQDLYFDLPSEWEATEWAVEIVDSDPKRFWALTDLLAE